MIFILYQFLPSIIIKCKNSGTINKDVFFSRFSAKVLIISIQIPFRFLSYNFKKLK